MSWCIEQLLSFVVLNSLLLLRYFLYRACRFFIFSSAQLAASCIPHLLPSGSSTIKADASLPAIQLFSSPITSLYRISLDSSLFLLPTTLIAAYGQHAPFMLALLAFALPTLESTLSGSQPPASLSGALALQFQAIPKFCFLLTMPFKFMLNYHQIIFQNQIKQNKK